jgi:hypothetical protein
MTCVVLRRDLEAPLEARVARDALRLLGIPSIKLTPRGQRGWQDRLFFVPGGRPVIGEFKRAGEGLEDLQGARRARLAALGYDVEMFDDYDGAMAALRRAATRGTKK